MARALLLPVETRCVAITLLIGLCKGFRCFLRDVVANALQDPVRIVACVLARVGLVVLVRTVETAGDGDPYRGERSVAQDFETAA